MTALLIAIAASAGLGSLLWRHLMRGYRDICDNWRED